MSDTAGDALVQTLIDWGVDTVFGLPGDGINGIMEALRTRQDKIRFIQVRHEEAAAFMACGYAKFTGRARRLPRHLRARRHPPAQRPLRRQARRRSRCSRSPGMQFHDLIDTHTQQDVELDKLFMDVCVYNARIMGPAHVENVVDAGLPDGARLPRRRPHHHPGRHAGASRSTTDARSEAQRAATTSPT